MQVIKKIFRGALLLLITSSALVGEEKKTVLITGANRGLGLEMAKQFIAGGYNVIGTARTPAKAIELKATGANVVKLDVTSEQDIADMASSLKGVKVDILINNAGYFGPALMTEKMANIETMSRKEMELCFAVNTMGPLFVTQGLLPNLRLSDTKKVINISTRSSQSGGTAYGYRVSKAALNTLTRCMAKDKGMKDFILVAIAPGHNKTDMGTKRGKLDPVESIRKIKQLIEGLEKKHHGKFWYYDGSPMKWSK